MQYRREIDGLRALAVVPVILFHAGFATFSGGFVGVDVFFVISGYLITSIILAEMQAGQFTLGSFYERRARRILPALFLVLAVSLVLAWLLLLPSDMQGYSESLFAAASFSSNVYFAMTSGYFGNTAEFKPLLHTWSLAAEEQFYLLFPLLLMLLGRGRRQRLALATLGVLFVASLAVAQAGSKPFSPITFFLLPARGWELLVGSFAACYVIQGHRDRHSAAASQLFSLLGVLLIGYAAFFFDRTTPFPGVYTLVPTLGTALVILFATPETLAGRLLGSWPLVGIGLVSYSAYLWHQPLLAFARHAHTGDLGVTALLTLVVSSFVLAYLSWRLVEVPLRDRRRFSRRQIFAGAALGSLAFVAFGLAGHVSKGFEARLSPMERRINAYSQYRVDEIYSRHRCFLEIDGRPDNFSSDCQQAGKSPQALLLWGDSHAAAVSEGLRRRRGDLMQYTSSLCPPVLDVDFKIRPNCRDVNRFVLAQIQKLKPREIWLMGTWHAYGPLAGAEQIARTLAQVRAASPASQITLVGALPDWPRPMPVMAIRHGLAMDAEHSLELPDLPTLRRVDAELARVAARAGVGFVSVVDTLCSGEQCPVITAYGGGYELVAWDRSHLTQAGSALLAGKLLAGVSTTSRP